MLSLLTSTLLGRVDAQACWQSRNVSIRVADAADSTERVYLSTSNDGTGVDLWSSFDTGTGNQNWTIADAGGGSGQYTIKTAGVPTDLVYLNTDDLGTAVNLWSNSSTGDQQVPPPTSTQLPLQIAHC